MASTLSTPRGCDDATAAVGAALGVGCEMVDDGPWARPPEGAEPAPRPADGAKRRPAWILPVLIAILVVVGLGGTWVIAASRAATGFVDQLEDEHSSCNEDLTIADVRPEIRAPADLPDGLDEVVDAFDAYFLRDRFSFTDESADEDGPSDLEIRYSVDGDVLERRVSDGFVGMIKPGEGVAQFEGDRFWVTSCVNGFPQLPPFLEADCVDRTTDGDETTYRWTVRRDGTCEDAPLWFDATLRDGELASWGLEGAGENVSFRTRFTVTEPRSLSWPSPLWIVPGFLAANDN